jgi:hypothetical protein
MPIVLTNQGGNTVTLGGGARRDPSAEPQEPVDLDFPAETPDEGSGSGWGMGAMAAGGAALAALLLGRNTSVAKKVFKGANELRYGSMLSGLAVPKSALGNVGASVIAALENKSLAPLKEFFSPATVRDYIEGLRTGKTVGPAAGNSQSAVRQGSSWLNLPGRMLGAGDSATTNALMRAGLPFDEAKRLLLQRDLPPEVADMADSTIGRFMIPFRTTPFNTLREGLDALKFERPLITTGAIGAGAAVGATTDDPKTMAITGAAAGPYALPYLLGGVAGKYYLKGDSAGKSAQVTSGVSPYSDYGIAEMITNPVRPFTKPAALSALDWIMGK